MTPHRWPSPADCLDLLTAHGAHRIIHEHAACVRHLALRFSQRAQRNGHTLDERIVSAASLLHDIGRTQTHKADHGWRGAQILRTEGIAEPICLAVVRHVGAGLTRADARNLGMPDQEYLPQTLEEKIVCHADTLYHLDQRQPVATEIQELKAKGLHRAAQRMQQLHDELTEILGTDPDDVPA